MTFSHSPRDLFAGAAVAAAPLLLAACAGPLNNEATIGDPLRPSQALVAPSIGPGDPEPRKGERMVLAPRDAAAERPEAEVADDGPSPRPSHATTGPRLGSSSPTSVAHQPRYTHEKIYNRTNARTRGEYPTAASALDMPTARGSDMQIKEAVVAPFAAGIDIALFPVRAAFARPWQRTRSGLDAYQRSPQERFTIPDGLRPIEPEKPAEEPGVEADSEIDPQAAPKSPPSPKPSTTPKPGARPSDPKAK